ncbi:hypothetical protein ACM0AZ_12540 [Mycobacteroides abscessus subsp. massiliense]|uniref:hypothetical protein n=1 Tax=Mycobacteroides abscessus TaxID=36809 RepID=UPI0009A682D7|nr:hypothetical protein [Mycobacteroides abscessus]MBN7467083.1 hypothetical protein [Mycobacteroides abscessus subsp. massiliense]SLI53531.1 Uncharacterised protein [Mycobacteroides abscessus subsp. massiliense]
MTTAISDLPGRSDLLAALALPNRRGHEPADLPDIPGSTESWTTLAQRHRELTDELLFVSHVRRSMRRDGGDAGVLAAGRRITDHTEASTREAWAAAVDEFLATT